MAIPKWNNVATPNFSGANALLAAGTDQIGSGINALTGAFDRYQQGNLDKEAVRTQANTDQVISALGQYGTQGELKTALDGALSQQQLQKQYGSEIDPLQVAQAITGKEQQFYQQGRDVADDKYRSDLLKAQYGNKNVQTEQIGDTTYERNRQTGEWTAIASATSPESVNYGTQFNDVVSSNDLTPNEKRSALETIAGDAGWNSASYGKRLDRLEADITKRQDTSEGYQVTIDSLAQVDNLINSTLDENAKAAFGGITGSPVGKVVQSFFNTDGNIKQREYDAYLSILTPQFIEDSGLVGVLTDRDLNILRQQAPATNATPQELEVFLRQRTGALQRTAAKLKKDLVGYGGNPDDYTPLSYGLDSLAPATGTNTVLAAPTPAPSGDFTPNEAQASLLGKYLPPAGGQ